MSWRRRRSDRHETDREANGARIAAGSSVGRVGLPPPPPARPAWAGSRVYMTDALNSVIAQLSDEDSTTVANSYAYSPYGESQTIGPDATANPVQYTSRENDGTGLYFYRARYYDPVLGRFVSSDPIGLGGGMNTYSYVARNPLSLTDPIGLDPWIRETWTPARVWTDMRGGLTTFYDPMTREILNIPTRNTVASNALPGAAGPYSGEFTFCQYPNSSEYGTAKWRTTDPRSRWIHGGGSRFGAQGALKPEQGWAPTMGCTRAQNQDVEQLCKKSTSWIENNPGATIPYSRW